MALKDGRSFEMLPRPPVRQAAILVGGRGTRLGGLTDTTPKPLMPCGDRPFLAWILRELTRFGIEEVLLLTGYLGEVVESALPAMRRTLPKSLRIDCIREPQPLGTGGALHNARAGLAESFLLCNGDSWLDCNLACMLTRAEAGPAQATGWMLLRRASDARRYGVVDLAGDRVVAFHERPDAQDDSGPVPGTINAGIYLFDRRILDDVSPVCSLEREVLPAVAAQGRLCGSVAEGFFIDIGIPEDLSRAQRDLPTRLRRPALFVAQDLLLEQNPRAGAATAPFRIADGVISQLRAATEVGWQIFLLLRGSAGQAAQLDDAAQCARLAANIHGDLRPKGLIVDDICPLGAPGAAASNADDGEGGLAGTLARWGLEAERCRLVSNLQSDLAAAKALGIPTVGAKDLAELGLSGSALT